VECSAIPPFALATARAEVDLLDASSGLKPLSGFPRKACFEQITLSTKVFGFGTLSHDQRPFLENVG
jgi:hypothetical protein